MVYPSESFAEKVMSVRGDVGVNTLSLIIIIYSRTSIPRSNTGTRQSFEIVRDGDKTRSRSEGGLCETSEL